MGLRLKCARLGVVKRSLGNQIVNNPLRDELPVHDHQIGRDIFNLRKGKTGWPTSIGDAAMSEEPHERFRHAKRKHCGRG